ncbi:unnamed protein product [Ectocarpus sp. CCAP 1310/34]|nr:unnamed protein product [Ectocarpus sp. CCAP 1310/34]
MSSLASVLRVSGRRSILLSARRGQQLVRPTAAARAQQAAAATSAAAPFNTSGNFDASYTTTSCSPLSRIGARGATWSASSSPLPFRRRQACGLRWVQSTAVAHQQHRLPQWATAETFSAGSSKRGMMSKASRKGDDSKGEQQQQKQQGEEQQYEDADYEPEPEEKISIVKTVAGLCVLGLVLAALGATVTELWPSHMAPQSIMSHAHDVFQADPDTANHFGTPLKVYGRDNNRHREGRRNFVEHVDHEDPIDKSKRTRVRFNVEGPHGHGMAYAEVSNKMESGEWVYLCVQDLQTGHVITLHDNRALLMAQAQAGSDEEKNAFRKMLGQ